MFIFNRGPISWDCRKQRTVALSTTAAEYMGMAECVKEAIYLERFIRELGFENLGDRTVYCDNKGSLRLAENPTFHARSKHIDIKHTLHLERRDKEQDRHRRLHSDRRPSCGRDDQGTS